MKCVLARIEGQLIARAGHQSNGFGQWCAGKQTNRRVRDAIQGYFVDGRPEEHEDRESVEMGAASRGAVNTEEQTGDVLGVAVIKDLQRARHRAHFIRRWCAEGGGGKGDWTAQRVVDPTLLDIGVAFN